MARESWAWRLVYSQHMGGSGKRIKYLRLAWLHSEPLLTPIPPTKKEREREEERRERKGREEERKKNWGEQHH
jgi:hypothetical protein